jgi:hypothetical protein
MIADGLPPWVRKEIDAICRPFLWACKDGSVKGKCMVAWATCTRPKDIGGLGITDFRLAEMAFQAKSLWLQRTDQERAWAELPLKSSPEAVAFFRASTYTVVGNGRSTLFWTDKWINENSIQAMAPALFAAVCSRAIKTQTVAEALHSSSWIRQISGVFPCLS